MKAPIIFLLSLFPLVGIAQWSAEEILDKCIQYHDPEGQWPAFQGTFFFEFENPEGDRKPSQVLLDRPHQLFRHSDSRKEAKIVRFENADTCYATLNGRADFSAEDAENLRLTCEGVQMYRDYFTYLYGLPMKLKDPGTIVHPEVVDTTFLQARHLMIKVSYEPGVGNEIWLFYIDPESFALKAYQFYRDEKTKKGEVILLSGEYTYQKMVIPRHRSWYTWPANKFLGTDRLEKIE